MEWLPWCEPGGKSPTTLALKMFLATWAGRLSWKQTAQVFGVGWETVYRSVAWVVAYGLEHQDLSGNFRGASGGRGDRGGRGGVRQGPPVRDAGVSDRFRLSASCCAVGDTLPGHFRGRSAKRFLSFFVMLKRHARLRGLAGNTFIDPIAYACSDLLAAYRKVIAKMLPGAYSGGGAHPGPLSHRGEPAQGVG